MTANKDQTETLVEQALARRAEQAPPDGFLLLRVHSRLRRRRTGRRTAAALVAATAVAAGITGVNALTGGNAGAPSDSPQAATASGDSRVATAPDGWRWESYRNVEVLVPYDWGYGTSRTPPCLVNKPEKPYVGRPGVIRAIACPDAPVKLAYRAPYMWFDDGAKARVRQRDDGWVEETRTLGTVSVTVFSNDAAVRDRILDSMRALDAADSHGCPVNLPEIAKPDRRPAAGGGLQSVGTVVSASRCKYTSGSGPALFAGSTLDGPEAAAAVRAILAAPKGSGPGGCSANPDTEPILVRAHGSEHDQDVVLRFDGCGHLGADDGTTKRQLARDAAAPILTGPYRPSVSDPELGKSLPPR